MQPTIGSSVLDQLFASLISPQVWKFDLLGLCLKLFTQLLCLLHKFLYQRFFNTVKVTGMEDINSNKYQRVFPDRTGSGCYALKSVNTSPLSCGTL